MRVNQIMTSPIVTIEPGASVIEAARLMLANRISGLPVVGRDGSLAGMLTEADLLRRSELGTAAERPSWLEAFIGSGRLAADYVHSHGRKVEEVMSPTVITTGRDTSIEEVVELMSRHRIKRLPVVEHGKLVGIVARSDVMRALATTLSAQGSSARSDDEIRSAILDELGRQSWTIRGLVRVHVDDGAVEIGGPVFDDRERQAIKVAVENVPGVKSVADRMIRIEPISGMAILPEEEAAAQPEARAGSQP